MNILKISWSAFRSDIAKIYLNGFGHPSVRSKILLASLLKEKFGARPFRLADFGCGNGHLATYFREEGLNLEYYGYDFSATLLDAARERYKNESWCHFLEADIDDPDLNIAQCDVVLFSHVLEMLQSPQASLIAAARNSPLIMIRFFEPPTAEVDSTELNQMDVGGPATVPYLRRKMSADYYNLILGKIGCRSVDVHQVDGDKDQVHVLYFS